MSLNLYHGLNAKVPGERYLTCLFYQSAVSCGPLRVPDYGTISPMGAKFTYGSEVTVTCMESFRVIGSSKRRCQADGTWSGVEPVCKGILNKQ